MGKGKRIRRQRQGTSARYPLVVDDRTARELGEQGLSELAANLWPKDCQSCGWDLGDDRPTVVVEDFVAFATVTLHHQRCRPAGWSETNFLLNSAAALVSYDVFAFLQTERASTGREVQRPMFFLNPGLEQISLDRSPTGWRVNTVAHWRRVGLRTPCKDLVVDAPVPGVGAVLSGDQLTVTLAITGQSWSVGATPPFEEAVRLTGGVMLAVSSAVVPSRTRTFGEFFDLMRTGQVTMGWISLAGEDQPVS